LFKLLNIQHFFLFLLPFLTPKVVDEPARVYPVAKHTQCETAWKEFYTREISIFTYTYKYKFKNREICKYGGFTNYKNHL